MESQVQVFTAYTEGPYLNTKNKNGLMDLGMFSILMIGMDHAHRQIYSTQERQSLRKP